MNSLILQYLKDAEYKKSVEIERTLEPKNSIFSVFRKRLLLLERSGRNKDLRYKQLFELIGNLKLKYLREENLFNYTIFFDKELVFTVFLNEKKTEVIGVLEYYKWDVE
ncbi:hypothetical protein [Tenacibaculum maritimum]|uniref:hypothetical protein n=1 Tax=Tenacibaculum maritimum TaxID=107401 RepID=UPI0012E68E67|nr:hypothetical protein [Tenacibaculum maritimum]MCD9564353.1 hypothetical protein [Tenacibaculum maritimum]MCD9567192.1 hypothetical protein [Tenacibaculum maritimum]MCD9579125.1 hypothetical protein [Tenacibaculum maritimum]MCD9598194.1 hypothetical protein [Tenacibaculum maritimum]MCD9612168.1 hypothetical protein [Tenacibaculum maritimum]